MEGAESVILAGDVGATKCNLAIFQIGDQNALRIEIQKRYESAEFSNLDSLVLDFLQDPKVRELRAQLKGASFGIAGPIVGTRVETPNLPWIIEGDGLEKTLHLPWVQMINDLEATGYGISTLGSDQIHTLNSGGSVSGHGALVAAGTGLGEALLINQGDSFFPVASEGGHTDFAPRNELEMDLLRFLLKRWSHVSYERVLSGPGLVNIFEFLSASGYGTPPSWYETEVEKGKDPGALISQAALDKASPLFEKALDLFVSLYGAEAGNLGLTVKATGGVYVGGGIAPKILPRLADGGFMEAFTDKGRMRSLMEEMPVYVILEPRTALFGAAYYGYLMS